MRNRTRMIAAAAAVGAALAAGSGAALASATGAKPGAHARTMSASEKQGGTKAVGANAAAERQVHDAITAAVARAPTGQRQNLSPAGTGNPHTLHHPGSADTRSS